jgi:hypothetical protein
MYKLSKQCHKRNLPKVNELTLNDPKFLAKLDSLGSLLFDIHQLTLKGFLDGPSFFTFFRKGGFGNMISCFKYLGSLIPLLGNLDSKWSTPFTTLFWDSCQRMKEFM